MFLYVGKENLDCIIYICKEIVRYDFIYFKDLLEKIFLDNGFYVNYIVFWYKSVIWLLWVIVLVFEV